MNIKGISKVKVKNMDLHMKDWSGNLFPILLCI